MATKKKVWLSAIAMITLITITGLFSAFTISHSSAASVKAHKQATQFQFNGSNASQVKDVSQWSEVTGSAPSCTEGSLPCYKTIEGDMNDLENYLDNTSTSDIIDNADARRN